MLMKFEPRKISGVDLTTGAIGYAQFYSRSHMKSATARGHQGFRGLTLGPVFNYLARPINNRLSDTR
jgi:hypothetical protein